jgi:glucokinase
MPYSRLIGITLGTGLGSAFIDDRHIITEVKGVPPQGWLYSCVFEQQRADDVFSTRGLLARLHAAGIHATDVESALRSSETSALTEVFSTFGADLGRFLKPFVSEFRAEAVLVTGGISEARERFFPSLRHSLSIPVSKGTLGRHAPLLGAAALYF